ncbi:MAG: helix-turn-helix domain-containing protein [Lachnospiraceae bacterium]|nr:MerR family transcriptional regulator [Candidatus Fimimorpha excrementavium]
MSETRYMISDASKQVNVEAHVLRYWEEELQLEVPRNEMGHRYYTEEHIRMFKQIKELKENGYQLKAIKMLLPKLKNIGEEEFGLLAVLSEEMNRRAMADEEETLPQHEIQEKEPGTAEEGPSNVISLNRSSSPVTQEEKMAQFQLIMNDIVAQAIRANTETLGQNVGSYISSQVSDKVLKELDYLMRLKEEAEETRFKQLDETIRQYQRDRSEAAAAQAPKEKRRRGLFHRKK